MTHSRLYRFFKYGVYALLAFDAVVFFTIEWAAAPHRFADGIDFFQVIEGFAATIDTSAWVILLLMFELETHVLEDHHFTRTVTITMHSLRAICYTVIIYAFYGYVIKLLYLLGITDMPSLTDLCTLATGSWDYAIDLDEYSTITRENCAALANGDVFYRFPDINAVVDATGRTEILRLAWVDAINSAVWLLVVLVLEIDVRLQDRELLTGIALKISNLSKYVLYTTLFLAAVYWGFKGDFVDFWDAFLWLVAFVFIEMNFFEWQQETKQPGVEAA